MTQEPNKHNGYIHNTFSNPLPRRRVPPNFLFLGDTENEGRFNVSFFSVRWNQYTAQHTHNTLSISGMWRKTGQNAAASTKMQTPHEPSPNPEWHARLQSQRKSNAIPRYLRLPKLGPSQINKYCNAGWSTMMLPSCRAENGHMTAHCKDCLVGRGPDCQ